MSDSENLPSNDSHLKPGERPSDKNRLAKFSGFAEGERPTLKTISRMTGLAVATVSRALHDAPDIGSGTKKRVQETADRIGYRPNRAGVRLRTGKTNVISLVLSTDHDVMNHTARLITSIAGTLQRHNLPHERHTLFPDRRPDGANPLHRGNSICRRDYPEPDPAARPAHSLFDGAQLCVCGPWTVGLGA